MTDIEAERRKYIRGVRQVLKELQGLWNGTMLPYVKLLEETEDPTNIAIATRMRDHYARMVSAATRSNTEEMEHWSDKLDQEFAELGNNPNLKAQIDEVIKKRANK